MKTFWNKFDFLPVAAVLLTGFALPAAAQVTCSATSAAIPEIRIEGNTELLGDIVIVCTGGTSTPADDVVPQVNLEVFLNTNLTSKVTYVPPTISAKRCC